MHSVSIIIPIYNGERYLNQCLESIQMQGYTDFEVLMIDDGSTDGSAGICMEFAERDSRFRYKHKENGGVSSARNVGIEESTGEWLLFVDADDKMPDNALGNFMACRGDERTDLVVGAYAIEDKEKQTVEVFRVGEPELNKIDSANMLFLENKYGYQGYIWNKLFKRSVVLENNIRFDERYRFNEDRLFCVEYICAMKGVAKTCDDIIYNYVKHPGSTIGTMGKDLRILDDYTSSLYIYERLKECHFPRRTVSLSRDNLFFSYDFIRHNLKLADAEEQVRVVGDIKSRAIRDSGGMLFFADNRLRRFLSRQINHLRSNKIYVETIF